MAIITSFKEIVRWDGWAQDKVPLLCTLMFYLILKHSIVLNIIMLDFVIFLVFSALSSVYGYLVNDLFDIELDRSHKKKNVFESLGYRKGLIIVIIVLLLSIVAGMRFVLKNYYLLLWLAWIFCATFYSAWPLRLKEKGILGLLTAFISQYPIPILLCFSAFGNFGSLDMWGIVLFATISGAAKELGHQRSDLKNDEKTETTTFAVIQGRMKVDIFYKKLLYGDLYSVLGILLLMAFFSGPQRIFYCQANVFIPLIAIYAILSIMVIRKMIKSGSTIIDPYYIAGRQDIMNLAYILFPNFILPFYLACILAIWHHPFAVFMGLFICITYINYPKANISRPIKLFINELRNFLKFQ